MSKLSQNNKTIVRNTLFLYLRKFLTMFIGLYSSRLLLKYLGIDNFGLYGLIGSIVVTFNSLKSLFASSIQRFLNVDRGNSSQGASKIFSIGLVIHLGIAVLFLIVVEVIGLLVIPDLNIAPEKISVAQWVLQFTILTAIMSIITVPYDAVIMAYEKFDAYAFISILDCILKLTIIFCIALSPLDSVITYSMLLFFVAVIIRSVNVIYCRKKLKAETRFHFVKDKTLIKEMTGFAGWNFFGNLGFSLTNEGINFILNLFGGVVANAARTIAYQVNTTLKSFLSDIGIAFIPQSMIAYSKGDSDRFYSLQLFNSKLSFSICLILGTPIILFTREIIELWLGEAPLYAVQFIQTLIFYTIIRCWHTPIDTFFKAANKMRGYQIIEISVLVLNLPLSWLALSLGFPLYSAFIVMIIVEVINLSLITIWGRTKFGFDLHLFIKRLVGPCLIALAIISVLALTYKHLHPSVSNFLQCCIGVAISMLATLFILFFTLFDKSQRSAVMNFIKRKR